MADKTQWTIEGADMAAATLRKAAAQLEDLSATNRKVADVVAARSQAIAPVLTGALRGSIKGEGSRDEAGVSSNLIYGPVIHNGWPAHNIAPNPFIADAFDQTASQWEALYEKAVNDAADQVHGA